MKLRDLSSEFSGVQPGVLIRESMLGVLGNVRMSKDAVKRCRWSVIGFLDCAAVSGFLLELHDRLEEVGEEP